MNGASQWRSDSTRRDAVGYSTSTIDQPEDDMSNQSIIAPEQRQAVRDDAPAPMRLLTPEELVQVVGGPEIQNGGGGTAVVITGPGLGVGG
jgi:hypothetical protein